MEKMNGMKKHEWENDGPLPNGGSGRNELIKTVSAALTIYERNSK